MKKLLIVLEILIFICCIVISTDSTDTMDSFWVCFPILNIVIMLPIVLIYSIFHTLKKKINNQQNKKLQTTKTITNKLSDKIFSKCKQEGTLNDIEDLKKLVNKNIKSNGTNTEFFDLNLIIAKIYNYMGNKDKTNSSLNIVKDIISHLGFHELSVIADKYLDKKRLWDAVYVYSCIIENDNSENIQDIPNIYYKRAIAYLGLEQNYYKNSAIEDLSTAIEKAKYLYGMFDDIDEKYLTEMLDKCNLKIGETYQDIKEYDKAINCYNQVLTYKCNMCGKQYKGKNEYCSCGSNDFSIMENENTILVQQKIQECIRVQQEKERKRKAELFYEKAIKNYKNEIYSSAKLNIEQALLNIQDSKYVEFLEKIKQAEKEQEQKQLKQYTENIEKEVVDKAISYNECPKYDEILIRTDNSIAKAKEQNIENNKAKEEQENKKIAKLFYEQARKDYQYKDYQEAEKNIEEAIKLSDNQNYVKLKNQIIKTKQDSEQLFNEALILVNTGCTVKNYKSAIKLLEKVQIINPAKKNECETEIKNIQQYIKLQEFIDVKNIEQAKKLIIGLLISNPQNKKLESIDKNIEKIRKEAHELYNSASKYLVEYDFEQAKICIQAALNIDNNREYKFLSNLIDVKLIAEEYYKSYLKELNNKHYKKALIAIRKAVEIVPEKEIYQNALKELTPLIADIYFQDGQKYFKQKNYEQAIKSYNNAITLDTTNSNYQEQLNIAVIENNRIQADICYDKSINNLKNGKFELAISDIQKALEIYPDNEIYQDILEKANNRMVDIATCNKGAVLTLDGFNEEKTEQFMRERKIMKWYDIESFSKHFNLQPHEQMLISDRLIFPLKPNVKKGRAIDW